MFPITMLRSRAGRRAGAFVVLLAGCLLATVSAHAAPKPTLSLDFDEGFDGVGTDGKVAATLEGKPELAEGKFGKALKSGPATGYLHFPTKAILSKDAGTVEMWVCPVDWEGSEEKFHAFFDVRGQGVLYLYKYYQGGLLMLSGPEMSGPYHSASAAISSWKPGEWHHIAGTWSGTRQCVYVDGKRIGLSVPGLPKKLGEDFLIGDNPWHIERTSSSLIDRVRVYDRLLSDDHIAAHFAGDYEKSVPVSEKSVDLSYTVAPEAKRLSTRAEILGADTGADDAQVTFTVAPAGQPAPAGKAQAFVQSVAAAEFSLADLKPGKYELTATITAGGTQLARIAKPFGIPTTEWMGNALALSNKVLPPWTPMRVTSTAGPANGGKGEGENGRTGAGSPTPPLSRSPIQVECWGRTYAFGAGPLPVQITSKGEPMLARPVALAVTSGGKALAWKPGTARVKSSSAAAAEVEGQAEADTPAGKVTLKTLTHIEYDGLMLVDFALDAPAGWKPDSVSLDVPLRPEVVLYRHRWEAAWAGPAGSLPEGTGVVDQAAFLPYAWLGDNDRGLFWFCESAEHWPNWQAKNAFETTREAGAVVMRLNLAAGQDLPRDWRWQMGFQATPVKPIPRDWRKHRLLPAPRGTVSILWPTPTKDSQTYYGYPEASDPALFEKRIADLHAKGVKAVPYSCLSFFSGASPEWHWFGEKWGMGGGDSGSSDVAAYGAVFQMICPKVRTYSDFIIWKNNEFMQRFGLDGYYHDNTHPYACSVEETGCGWKDAKGAVHPTYPILAFRDLYRRLYTLVKSANPNAFLMAHMSGKVCIPILAYEDSILDGEHFRGKVKDSYMDMMGLDSWRAEYMGRQWGIMPYFLPEFEQETAKKVEPTRGLVGLLLLHDIQPWPIWSNPAPWNEAFDALDAFGYTDSDFIPYFDKTPPATTEMKDVYASAYKRDDGRVLMVVVNTSREERSGTIRLNGKRLGVPTDSVISWPDKAPAQRAGDVVTLMVPGQGYRMLVVAKE